MKKIILICWNEAERNERARLLEPMGYSVSLFTGGPPILLRDQTPDLFVIDLNRLPSQGKDFAVSIRQQKTNRLVPLVFAGGQTDKVDRIRSLLPDATYTTWEDIQSAMQQALSQPAPEKPVVPGTFDSYAGTALPKKLGIRKSSSIRAIDAPQSFQETLGEMPEGAYWVRSPDESAEVVILFVQTQKALEEKFSSAAQSLKKGGKLWIAWPKKAAKSPTDLAHDWVQSFGLQAGFMDYKICSIDETWSGLCFTRKKS
jgi:CheY-like chemotaxis protein